MAQSIEIGDRVKVLLDSSYWKTAGWVQGTVVRIVPYSRYRRFYWVDLDEPAEAVLGSGLKQISVLNPKHIERA